MSVVLDDEAELYRGLLVALEQKSDLVVFAHHDLSFDLDSARVLPFSDFPGLRRLLLNCPAPSLFLDLRCATAAQQLAMWRMAYFHVRVRGAYVHTSPTTAALPSWSEAVALTASKQKPTGEAFNELSASTRWVRTIQLLGQDAVAYKKARRHLYQVHDRDAATLVPHREPSLKLDLLSSVPAETVASKAMVRHHGATEEVGDFGFAETFEVPELHCWHYRGEVTLDSHMLAYCGTTALPASFRFPARTRLENPRLKRFGDGNWARLAPNVRQPKVTLEGDYFDVNGGYPSMFGHVMTQSIHKLWGWDDAKRQLPDLKALAFIRNGKASTVERTLLNAYGIADEDIRFISEPVHLESYVSPTNIWGYAQPFYASSLAPDIWRRIGRGLGVTEVTPRDKIFVSRHDSVSAHRFCRNARDVDEVFRQHGFTVVYPEEHSLAEQAQLFAKARVVAGFGGSAMFNMMYGAPENVIVLNHDGYRVRNEHLFTALLGCTVDYFWSKADVPHPVGGYSKEAFISAWEFDFERNGQELTELLESLA